MFLSDHSERPTLRPEHFEIIRTRMYEFCGINLTGKEVLVNARLGDRLAQFGFGSFHDYCEHIQQNPSGTVFLESVDLLTTNHTSFFREDQHFDLLRSVILPEIQERSPAIWSAACSSGEEPYSIAITLLECLGEAVAGQGRILATDLSARVLKKARRALYPLEAAEKIPEPLRRRCLLRGMKQFKGQCLIRPELRAMIDFRQFNLLDDCSSFGPFDVIFCRNVMIYFNAETQAEVVRRLVSRLKPGGYLLVGHAESLQSSGEALQAIAPAAYRKRANLVTRKRTP